MMGRRSVNKTPGGIYVRKSPLMPVPRQMLYACLYRDLTDPDWWFWHFRSIGFSILFRHNHEGAPHLVSKLYVGNLNGQHSWLTPWGLDVMWQLFLKETSTLFPDLFLQKTEESIELGVPLQKLFIRMPEERTATGRLLDMEPALQNIGPRKFA
jgi:hypothetical protein